MRYFLLISLSILCFLSSLRGQETPAQIIIESSTTVNPWNHLEVNNKPSTFQFAIVTDRTGSVRPGVFPDAVNKLNLLQPEFVMSVGDLISGYTEDEEKIDQEWDEFTGFISKLQMPFFYLPGNHDYINDIMARKWKERFGKDYYHFVYKDVLFQIHASTPQSSNRGKGHPC
ncbi:MAG: metallophosphoesterase, partial [Bacteroidota bacterium]